MEELFFNFSPYSYNYKCKWECVVSHNLLEASFSARRGNHLVGEHFFYFPNVSSWILVFCIGWRSLLCFFYIVKLQLTGGWLYAGETWDFNSNRVNLSVKNHACYHRDKNKQINNAFFVTVKSLQIFISSSCLKNIIVFSCVNAVKNIVFRWILLTLQYLQ